MRRGRWHKAMSSFSSSSSTQEAETGKLVKIFTTTTEHATANATYIDIDFPARQLRAAASVQAQSSSSVATSGNLGAAGSATASSGDTERSVNLAYIRFRNYYSHTITVRQLMTPIPGTRAARGVAVDGQPSSAPASQPELWSTVLTDYRLMKSSHHEDDAQAWHVLCVETDFCQGSYYPEKLVRLRFVVSQPSAMWNTFSLRNIECFEVVYNSRNMNRGGGSMDLLPVGIKNSGLFSSRTRYTPSYEHVRMGTFDHPRSALAKVQGCVSELADTLQKLRECKRSKIGNPSSALDFSHGVATAVRISHTLYGTL